MIDQLKDNFKTFETQLNGSSKSSWHELRKEAFEIFTQNGFPKVKDEEYRYTHITRALEKSINFSDFSPVIKSPKFDEKPVFHDADALHIYVTNGVVNREKLAELNLNGLDIITIKTATEKYPDEVATHFGKYADVKKDPFTAFNMAFSYEGVFIKIHKNTILDKPVIIHYSTDQESPINIFQSRNLVLVEQHRF